MMMHPIKAYRQAHELTLAELAVRASTTRSTVSRIEAGLLNPSLDLLRRLTAAMNGEVTADAIIAAARKIAA
jgi:transcriptional regulator with XRE-family HTH domain